MPLPNEVKLGVPENEQLNYIRRLALYHFRKAQWNQKFNESECPEVTVTKPIDKHLCGELAQECLLPPEPPLTICDYRRDYPGCVVDNQLNPDCEANPKLCLPPSYCDLSENQMNEECIMGDDEECAAGDDRLHCRWATRCDLDEYKDLPNCSLPNPCQADPKLCLTICDNNFHKNSLKCKIQKCELFPDTPLCKKIEQCKIKRECTHENLFTNPKCCPPTLCKEECMKEDEDCDVVDPPTECVWGYKLGDKVSEVLVSLIDKNTIDEGTLVEFLQCYNEVIQTTQTISLKCFEESLGENYKLLTEEMKRKLQETAMSYDNVQYTVNTSTEKEIQLSSSEKVNKVA